MNLSIEDVLKLTGGKLLNTAPEVQISGVASLDEACPGEASFLGNEKYFKDFLATKAGLVLVPPSLPQYPEGVCLVEVENPSLAFNALVDHFMKAGNDFVPGIADGAVVAPSAKFNPEKVRIGANAVVEADAEIGDGCDIGPGCVIGKSAKLGEHCKLHARVVVRERCILGHHVTVQPGAVIGSDGFGFLLNKETGCYDTIDQVGIVVIGNHVDIGANATIDRARFGRTVIGDGCKLDNLVQVAHNVTMGNHTVMCSQSGIAGSTHIGTYVTLAAQVGVAGHLTVGDKAILAARTGVISNLEGGQPYFGSPSSPYKEAMKQYAALHRMPEALKELRALRNKVEELEQKLGASSQENAGK